MDTAALPRFWGAQTSYLNFCEEDYVVTRYVAEFINTLSSLVFVAYGIYGLSSHKGPQSAARIISYAGLIGVGTCSSAYHMTLKYHTQMSDELSMHLLTTPIVYRLLTCGASPQYTKVTGLVLATLFTIVMVTHMVMDEFLLHASTFALSILLIIARSVKVIPQQVPDPVIRKRITNITRFGCCCFFLGYFAWLVDSFACRMLIQMRNSIGLPVAFLLELHGWWHVLTAVGGYIAVAVTDTITEGIVREDPTDLYAWPVPLIVNLMSGGATDKANLQRWNS